MRLYRPVGLKELLKIIELEFKGFPPRLPEQPIFYPVLNMGYAEEIASKWNTEDPVSNFVGYVLEFDVENAYISKYKAETVGNKNHKELWIPAQDLETFNKNIIGFIRIVKAYYGDKYSGLDALPDEFNGRSLIEQFELIKSSYKNDKKAYTSMILTCKNVIITNYLYWKLKHYNYENKKVLDDIYNQYREQGIIIGT
ncbi:MAG TPA: hypothetical protein PLH43_04740 [Acetivibrio sp.]|uniref:hypothetical protein n=1 Tax=Acetivibrio sp. TaxID=1872092 RepID=UPI002BF55342|nr:hypothetical protein [Acetivibrio sp.]HOM02117.1 hypothetical protein [Acetivibrio sp.]